MEAYDTRKAAVAESKMDKEELGERIKFLKVRRCKLDPNLKAPGFEGST